MIRMFTTTYGESVISTPMWAIGEPSGPIENGTTYMVRPRIDPSNRPVSVAFISAGGRQLLVTPASSSFSEQMNVRSSTRATSPGSERARNELGRLASASFVKVPLSTSSWHIRWYSVSEPSHQTTWSGWVSAATSATHWRSFRLEVRSVDVSMAVKVFSVNGGPPRWRQWGPAWLSLDGDGFAFGGEAGRAHVDLRAEPKAGRPPAVIGVEDHSLALPEHAEHGPLQCVGGQLVLAQVRVAQDGACAGSWVVRLDDALHMHSHSCVRSGHRR